MECQNDTGLQQEKDKDNLIAGRPTCGVNSSDTGSMEETSGATNVAAADYASSTAPGGKAGHVNDATVDITKVTLHSTSKSGT